MTQLLVKQSRIRSGALPSLFEQGFFAVVDDDKIYTNIPGFSEISNLPPSDRSVEQRIACYILTHYSPDAREDSKLIDEFSNTFIAPTLLNGGNIPLATVKDWLFDHGRNNELVNT